MAVKRHPLFKCDFKKKRSKGIHLFTRKVRDTFMKVDVDKEMDKFFGYKVYRKPFSL